jgi:hypothetical protein
VPTVWLVPAGDNDCDGFTDAEEAFMGTDALAACPTVVGAHDAWPPDFDMNRWVNILDAVQVTPPVFGSSPPDPNYSVRKDLNGDGVINILDIVRMTPPMFGQTCTP